MADDDFASFMRDAQAARPRRLVRGDRVQGAVVHITADSVFVDLGTRSDGRIARSELTRHDGTLRVAVGDAVEATVVDPDAPEGPVLAVLMGRESGIDVEALELARDTETVVEGTVSRAVKGGLEIDLAGLRAFCPASQVEPGFVTDLAVFVGQAVRVLVVEIRDDGKSVVVSRRRVLERERAQRAEQALSRLAVGQVVEGEVSSLQSYGAFVDLEGIEGLIHISELSAQRVGNVEDVVSVGERVSVKVLAIEPGKDGPRIRLSMKALVQAEAPRAQPEPDEVLQGEVIRHLPHGVIVATPKGEGLVPARELDLPQGADHRRAYAIGDVLEVVRLDGRAGKLRFSARAVEEVRARNAYREYQKQAPGAASASQGALAAQLGKLNLGKLPEGPPPPPPSVPGPDPARAVEPVPAAAAHSAASASSASASAPAAPSAETASEPSKPKRRRIVSGR